MKIALAIILSGIMIGLVVVGYLYSLSQSDDVMSALYTWEKENRFSRCAAPDNLALSQRITLTKSVKTAIDAELERTAEKDIFALGAAYIINENEDRPEQEAFSIGMYILYKAAQRGDAAAMNEIGASLMYCGQEGVVQNLQSAKHWFDKSASLNDEYALYNLAVLGLMDNGILLERSTIIKNLQQSAGLGNRDSKNLLVTISARVRLNKMEKLALKLRPKPTKSHDDFILEAVEELLEETRLDE